MLLDNLHSMVAAYHDLKRKTELAGAAFNEASDRCDELEEEHIAMRMELYNLQLSCMESFTTSLDDEDTVQ